ncbi:hypothetical protein Q1695_011095 [Nippostrongylus brasiliensis]|nr:hypothetical protein Q1695_011095 [Nippostrongylus brasiliensis]
MTTLGYIIVKIMIISLNFVWITVYCSKWSKRSKKIHSAQSVSYIEEDTKREEHFVRPDWDKDFPKILPPPVRVPEKENKEVDVELDMNIMPPADKPLGDMDLLRSDVIDPNKKTSSASAKNRNQLEVNMTQDSVVQQPQVVDDRKGAGETKPPAGKSPLECKK